jgi:two-component system copper resistance phosphate regulon response regulator CusR
MRVLLIDDDIKQTAYLKKGLIQTGISIDVAHSGSSGLALARQGAYDVIVLEVMLPGMSGWTVIEQLRLTHSTPILVLTACDAIEDRVRGFELGGDDYVLKPFVYVELLARLRALARRGPLQHSERIVVHDLEIDLLRRRVKRAGARVDLTPREFSLLQLLARRQGQVLSRTQIASHVWETNFDTETNVVEVAVRRLRGKIDDGFLVKLIQTVRGVGYVMEAQG